MSCGQLPSALHPPIEKQKHRFNRSNKAVIAVKLGWRLFYYDSPKDTLMSGESPFLGVPLNVKERRVVEFPLVSFAKISKPLLKNGRIDGDFKIEVVVTDFLFADNEENTAQSSWSSSLLAGFLPSSARSSTKEPLVEVVSYAAPPLAQTPCQDQECKYEQACFKCKDLKGVGCKPDGCSSCEETA